VVVETLRFDEQEQEQPEQPSQEAPATENFHITDDNLGVGTMKEKFRRNMDAIHTPAKH